MSDNPPPPSRPQGNAGCGTTVIAVIALLVALSAGSNARGNASSVGFTQYEVRQLESKVRTLERRIEELETR